MRMMSRYWMTGCMAIVLLAANQWSIGQDDDDTPAQRRGLIAIGSRYPLEQTVTRLAEAARSRGFALIAQVKRPAADNRDAAATGEQVLVFGTPDGHTPVMQTAEQDRLDLPLKMILQSHADGTTTVLLSDPAALAAARSGTPGAEELAGDLAALPEVVGAALG